MNRKRDTKMIIFILVLSLFRGTHQFCLWGCEEDDASSSSSSDSEINIGNGNLVLLESMGDMRQAHETHLLDIKIGVFSVLGILLATAVGIALWWVYKKFKQNDRQRVERNAIKLLARKSFRKKLEQDV